jgi:hypothetical protein
VTLWRQYRACRRNKRNTLNALRFELNAEENLLALQRELRERTYRPGPSIRFVPAGPKPREMFAADFRDRVGHHVLVSRPAAGPPARRDTGHAAVGGRLGADRERERVGECASGHPLPVTRNPRVFESRRSSDRRPPPVPPRWIDAFRLRWKSAGGIRTTARCLCPMAARLNRYAMSEVVVSRAKQDTEGDRKSGRAVARRYSAEPTHDQAATRVGAPRRWARYSLGVSHARA